MKVDVRIMAVPQRRHLVRDILFMLGMDESHVTYDDRPHGGDAMYTATKCWLHPVEEGYTHRVVLQDDVIVCKDFQKICEQMAETHPDAIFTLYSSRVRSEHKKVDSPYIRVKGESIWGQGVMMPVSMIRPCFEWIWEEYGRDYPHDDCAIGYYAHDNQIPVFTTIPSTIQHIGHNSSVLGYNNKNKVSKVWEGFDVHADWSAKEYSTTPTMLNGNYPPKSGKRALKP